MTEPFWKERGLKRVLRDICGIALVIGLALPAAAQQAPRGSAALLELGQGARPLGLGGAFVGLADGPEVALYNPAALAFFAENRLSAFAGRPFETLTRLGLSLATPQLGLVLTQLSAPGVLETNAFGNPSGRFVSYADRAGVAGLGWQLLEGLALGAALKVYWQDSGPVQGFGWAVDPALAFRQGPLRLGAIWHNPLNAEISFNNGRREPWGRSLTLGTAWSQSLRPQLAWHLAADLTLGAEGPRWHLGGELELEALALRLGRDGPSWTLGAGVAYGEFRFDWAYALHPVLPQTLYLSAAWAF